MGLCWLESVRPPWAAFACSLGAQSPSDVGARGRPVEALSAAVGVLGMLGELGELGMLGKLGGWGLKRGWDTSWWLVCGSGEGGAARRGHRCGPWTRGLGGQQQRGAQVILALSGLPSLLTEGTSKIKELAMLP